MLSNTTKVIFDIPTNEIDDLKQIANRKGMTITNQLRKAIGSEVFFDEAEQRGAIILLQELDGTFYRVVRS